MNPSSFRSRVHALYLLLVAVIVVLAGARPARAQETWAPLLMFDGATITINNTATPIANGPIPNAQYVYAAPGQAPIPNPLISFPNGIVENPRTNEWIVADSYHSRLLRFATDHNASNPPGAYLGALTLAAGSIPYTPVVDDDGTILTPDTSGSNAIFAFVWNGISYGDPIAITSFLNGTRLDGFNAPSRLALVPDPANGMHIAQGFGTVVVLDSGNNRVLKLNPAGGIQNGTWTMTLTFGKSAVEFGDGPGFFAGPTGLAVDAAGNIYVTDPQNETLVSVQVFDPNGNPLQTISQGLSAPWSIAIDPTGRLFITDTSNNRLAVFAKYDAQNPTQSLAPLDVHIGSANLPLGGIVAFPVPNPAGPIGTLQEPAALVFDQFGRLLVADSDDFRIEIFDKAGLNVTALADPQTVATGQTSVSVRVSVSLPDGNTDPVNNVLPAIPTAAFQQGQGVNTAVVTVPPACVVMPGNSACVDLSNLNPAGLPLTTNNQPLVYAFEFNRIQQPEVDGPVWFSVSASGLDGSNAPVQSGVAQTYAIAVGGDHFNAPTITSSLSPTTPTSGWYNAAPVTLNLQASLVNSGMGPGLSGVVQEIDFNFGPTAPDEGDFYTCFNYFTADVGAPWSCALPVYKEGVTQVWYRVLSTMGLYDHLTPSTIDSTVMVPGWSSVNVKLDYSAPSFSLTPVNPSNRAQTLTPLNGWYKTLPIEFDYTATDLGSLLNTVTVNGGGGVVSSGATTPGQPFAKGTITFSQQGLFNVNLTATDIAGNVGVGPYTIGIDTTAPAVTFASATSTTGVQKIGGTQWSTSPIIATFNATDALSGFDANATHNATCTAAVPLGVSQSVACTIADYAGNVGTGTAGPFGVDNLAPTITFSTPAPNAMVGATPWYKGPTVAVTFTGNDNGGVGFTGGTETQTSTKTSSGAAVSATFTDLLKNTASLSAGPFNIDGTGPVVTTATTYLDGTPATGVVIGGVKYFKAAVKVVFTATDAGAGFSTVSPVATSTQTVTVSGAAQLVTQTFTDVVGNATTTSLGTYAVDATAPTIKVPQPMIVSASTPAANPTSAVVTFSVSATDSLGTPTTTCSPASGASFPFGTTTVSCTATDVVGNTATGSFTVTVQDKTPPVLHLPANIFLNATVAQNVTFSVTATDNLDPQPTVSCSPASGSIFQVTTTTVSCTATDASGNSSTGSFTVTLSGVLTPPACTIPPSGEIISSTSWNKFGVPANTAPVVWVHAQFKPTNVPTTTVSTVQFTGVSFVLNGTAYPMPDGIVTFDPSAPMTSTTSFAGNVWRTTINPKNISDENFFTGAAIPVDATLEGGGQATIQFTTQSNNSTLGFSWQWSAAVFTYWPTDWNQANIQPYHGNGPTGSQHADTPDNTTIQRSLIQGPRGGGGSNYTGSWSATGQAVCHPTIVEPDAVADTATTLKGVATTINVLANDLSPLGYTLTVTSATGASHGTTTVNANGTITYTPVAGYAGTDTFSYTVSDGHGGTDMATVTVTITAHFNGDGCDHDNHTSGHHAGDGDDHDKDCNQGHHDGDGCDHDLHRNGHYNGDGCAHDRSR